MSNNIRSRLTQLMQIAWQVVRQQMPAVRVMVILSTLLGVVLLIVVATLSSKTIEEISREPSSWSHVPTHAGLFQIASYIVWSIGVGICFFVAWLLYKLQLPVRKRVFWIYSGTLLSIFLLDDAFLLHEDVLLNIGIPEITLYLIYLVGTLLYAPLFREEVQETPYLLLLIGLGMLGVSALVDLNEDGILESFFDKHYRAGWLMEDGIKLPGILTYNLYFVYTASRELLPRLQPAHIMDDSTT